MAKITQREAIVKALIARGYMLDEKTNLNRAVLVHPEFKVNSSLLFVTKMGSLRKGRAFTKSHLVNKNSKQKLLQEGGYYG